MTKYISFCGNLWEQFNSDIVATSKELFMSVWIRTQFTLGNSAFSLLRQRSTLNIFQAAMTCIEFHMFICTMLSLYIPVCALQPVLGKFSNKRLLLLPFRFPLFSFFVCLFSLFLYILSLALIVVDPSLLEYMSNHRDMGEMLKAKEY